MIIDVTSERRKKTKVRCKSSIGVRGDQRTYLCSKKAIFLLRNEGRGWLCG